VVHFELKKTALLVLTIHIVCMGAYTLNKTFSPVFAGRKLRPSGGGFYPYTWLAQLAPSEK